MKCQELQIAISKLEQDEKSVAFELDRLKQQSDAMLKDQCELQAEIDALDKHMANLNNQNYCLQKELEDFVDADEAVKRNLDRKYKVDNIRTRVDDVIRRSQVEVEHRQRVFSGRPRETVVETVTHGPGRRVTKSATHYSPVRPGTQVPPPRVAWREPAPADRYGSYGGPRDYYPKRTSQSPLRKTDYTASSKQVSFANGDKKE